MDLWILTDGKAGHLNQCLGVAQALGVEPTIHTLKPRRFGRLLGLFRPLWRLDPTSLAPLSVGPYPRVVLSAGNLGAPVLRWLKTLAPRTCVVQLMTPKGSLEAYDLVAVPAHDLTPPQPNVVVTLGAPNKISAATLATAQDQWRVPLADYPRPRVAVLVGGKSKRYTFDDAKAVALAKDLKYLQQATNASLLVTPSRRTGASQTRLLKSYLGAQNVYFWGEKGHNPYLGFLACADAVVVTADSVSMISEAATAGKPVYVYDRHRFWGKKFERFFKLLEDAGYIFPITDTWLKNPQLHFTPVGKPLADAAKVADAIRRWLATRA